MPLFSISKMGILPVPILCYIHCTIAPRDDLLGVMTQSVKFHNYFCSFPFSLVPDIQRRSYFLWHVKTPQTSMKTVKPREWWNQRMLEIQPHRIEGNEMKMLYYFHSYKLLLIITLYLKKWYLLQKENMTKFDTSSKNQLMIFLASSKVDPVAEEWEEEKRLEGYLKNEVLTISTLRTWVG